MGIRRFTVRRLMLSLAVIAACLGAWRLLADRRALISRAADHHGRERLYAYSIAQAMQSRARGDLRSHEAFWAKMVEAWRLRAAFHARWRRVYEDAAARPWERPPHPPPEPGEDLIREAYAIDRGEPRPPPRRPDDSATAP